MFFFFFNFLVGMKLDGLVTDCLFAEVPTKERKEPSFGTKEFYLKMLECVHC